jgi:ankyrin repeat protein
MLQIPRVRNIKSKLVPVTEPFPGLSITISLVNAADYDRRTAAHIAAAEGNFVAFKLLVEFGCD